MPRWLLRATGPAVGLAVVAAGVAVHLANEPAAPESPSPQQNPPEESNYLTTPDPCKRLRVVLVRELVGDAPPERTETVSYPLLQEKLECTWSQHHPDAESTPEPSPDPGAVLTVSVRRYKDTPGGTSAADVAQKVFERRRRICIDHLTHQGGEACRRIHVPQRSSLEMEVLWSNVLVSVTLDGPRRLLSDEHRRLPSDQQDTFERLARDMLLRLAVPGPAPTP